MNFFRIFFALCSGTEVIPKLISFSLFRVFGHLLLLLFLCAVVTTFAYHVHHKNIVNETTSRFFQRTGDICLTEKSIQLGIDPGVTRSYTAGPFRFDYFASPGDFTSSVISSSQADFTVFCFPTGAALRFRYPVDRNSTNCRLLVLPADMLYSIFGKAVLSSENLTKLTLERDRILDSSRVYEAVRRELLDTKKLVNAEKDEKIGKIFVLRAPELAASLNLLFALLSGLFFLTEAIMVLLLSIVFFSLAQLIRSSNDPVKIPFRACLITTVYATFPPLLIASGVQALELTFPTFQMTYFIAFFIYQIFAFRTLFRHYDPRAVSQDDNSER